MAVGEGLGTRLTLLLQPMMASQSIHSGSQIHSREEDSREAVQKTVYKETEDGFKTAVSHTAVSLVFL